MKSIEMLIKAFPSLVGRSRRNPTSTTVGRLQVKSWLRGRKTLSYASTRQTLSTPSLKSAATALQVFR